MQRSGPEVITFNRQQVEGNQLHLLIMLAAMQPVEPGNPASSSHTASPSITKDGIRSSAAVVQLRRCTENGQSNRPIKAAPGQQPDALVNALDDQATTIVLDLVLPIGPRRHDDGAGRVQGSNGR